MSSETPKSVGVQIGNRVLDAAQAAKGRGRVTRVLARNVAAFPIAHFAPDLASDQRNFGGDPVKAQELEQLGKRAQKVVDDLK